LFNSYKREDTQGQTEVYATNKRTYR